MAKTYYPKPRLVERWTVKPKGPNQFCRKITYRNGRADECGDATEGRVYCPSCATKLLTLTDRQSPEQPAPKAYAWTQDQIFPRKRA